MRFYLTETEKTDKTWKRQDKDKKTSKKTGQWSDKPWTRQDKEKLNTLLDSEKIRQDLNETRRKKAMEETGQRSDKTWMR